MSPVVGVKINITIFFFSLTGQERFGNMTRVGLFVLHHIHAAQVTYMLWFNGLFPASHSHGTIPPCWRAKVALRQDKQKNYHLNLCMSFVCPVPVRLLLSSVAVLTASCKGPILSWFEFYFFLF